MKCSELAEWKSALLRLATLVALSASLANAQDSPQKPVDPYALSQQASMRAMNICSGLWQGGLDLPTIDRDLNGIDASFGSLDASGELSIDESERTVSVGYSSAMPPRVVAWRRVLGCIQLPPGASVSETGNLPQVPPEFIAPPTDSLDWPMGDVGAFRPLPGVKGEKIEKLVAAAFDGKTYRGNTWAVIVLKNGRIIAERYADGYDLHSASQTHSAAKSFSSTLMGIAQGRKIISLGSGNLLAQWRRPGDPRARITLANLLHMASGLNTGGVSPPRFMDPYTQGLPVTDVVSGNFLTSAPGSEFHYSPADTMLAMRALREAMNDDAAYLRFPYEALFWRIGMTRTSMNVDWDGNVFGSGQTWSSARDFARFGLLYLNDGKWMGERILPEGWVDFATRPAPAQPAQGPGYGAQFWLYGPEHGLPAGSFTPSGGQGHYAMVVPSENLVVVRRGYDQAAGFDIAAFTKDVIAAIGK